MLQVRRYNLRSCDRLSWYACVFTHNFYLPLNSSLNANNKQLTDTGAALMQQRLSDLARRLKEREAVATEAMRKAAEADAAATARDKQFAELVARLRQYEKVQTARMQFENTSANMWKFLIPRANTVWKMPYRRFENWKRKWSFEKSTTLSKILHNTFTVITVLLWCQANRSTISKVQHCRSGFTRSFDWKRGITVETWIAKAAEK